MATVFQPIVNELNTVLVQLCTELRGLQTDAAGAGIAICSSAFAQDFQDQEDLIQEDEAEQAYPTVDSPSHWQHHSVTRPAYA